MENCTFINSLRNHFFVSISMLERIIEICPDELWNKKVSGFVFWQQIFHTFTGGHFWLRTEKTEFEEPFKDKNVYPELEKDPETTLSKDTLRKFCHDTKEIADKWFSDKDDNWLKLPSKLSDKVTNYNLMIGQIKHMMYHIGHCEAVFRENGIETGDYLDYFG